MRAPTPAQDGDGFTKGPWRIVDRYPREGVIKVGSLPMGLIAYVGNGFNIGTVGSDARLIAASPDVYKALWAALSAANELGLSSSVFPREQIEAALSKVTGGARV